MSILNSLPTKIGMATETSNGLMSYEDKKLVNKINRMENDVAGKMNRDEKIKNSQLDTSKNDYKIQEVNLSAEILSKLNGIPIKDEEDLRKIPILTYESITTDLYADNSVTSEKRTAVGSVAVIASDEYCNFRINDNDEIVSLSIPANYTVYYGSYREDIIDTPETLSIPKGVPSVITYSRINGFTSYPGTAILEDDYLVGVFDGTYVTMFFGRYTVNGSVVLGDQSLDGATIKDFSVDSRKLAIQHGVILSDKTEGPYLNINLTANRIEVVKDFNISIADQYTMTIKNHHSISIPENIHDKEYLYIYYDLGTDNLGDKLNVLWSSNDIRNTILTSNEEKLVLLGIVDIINNTAVGLNSEYISVNKISIHINDINYMDIFTGSIVFDFMNKQITSKSVKTFLGHKLMELTENDTQTITLTDDMITDIIGSGIPYTLAASKVDYDDDKYRLVFGKTEDIRYLGLDTIYLTTIKKYDLSNNGENITIIKADGNVVKSNNIISSGYTLPIDNQTIVAEMVTELVDGILTLTTTTVPGTSVVDPSTNMAYEIKERLSSDIVVNNLHGLYSVLFNTESGKIEVLPISDSINSKVYISLGFVSELNDSLAYTATGAITDHITLNAYRPSNYAIITGPDPDKGYDWSDNRLVLPKDIYLLTNSQYSLYCQNMSMNKYIDNDYILYELGLPHGSIMTENVFAINSPVAGEFETRIVGKFKGNNNCLFKDVNIHFEKPEGKELSILCIGDDTVDMNMPSYIKEFLVQLGYTPTMLGTTKNVINTNGYGMKNMSEEFGEGHKGWRLTDFMCKTKRKDGSSYLINNNPFMNNSIFDFSNYMTSNGYDKVDVVVISVGLNDITGYHTASSIEDIEKLTIYQNIEQLPNMYKEMITNIHKFDPNIKIIINPTIPRGTDDDFNKKSLLLTETLLYELKDIQNTFFAPGYLTQPTFVSANKASTDNYETYNDINDTKMGSSVSFETINGVAQSILAYTITSTIVGVTK